MQQKPRNTADIQRSGQSTFRGAPAHVSLAATRRRRSGYWLMGVKGLVVLASIGGFVAGSAYAPANVSFAQVPAEERAVLEAQLKQLEAEMNAHQAQIDSYRAQGRTLGTEVGKLNATVSSLNAQIKALQVNMSLLDRKIAGTEIEISATKSTLEQNQEVLAQLVRKAYIADQASLLEVMLKHEQLSEFFTDVNSIQELQGTVKETIGTISSLKGQLEGHKVSLGEALTDAQRAQQYQAQQKLRADEVARQKQALLSQTKGQESKYVALLKDTQARAAQIRARLFSFLGGGQMQFGDAYQLAKTAGEATGVRPALILAVLDRESALGANVGRCNYKSSMSPTQQPIYLEITKELGIDPDSVMVSCAILSDGAYGGAMGPAQFMPATWQMYKARISSVTGRRPPSPWNNMDAVTATALYMKDAGAVAGNVQSERIAAAKYYAGGNYARFLSTYGQAVVDRANRFQDDIDLLEGR
jgi:peptidoglycan hydrolase CwlO-like protein